MLVSGAGYCTNQVNHIIAITVKDESIRTPKEISGGKNFNVKKIYQRGTGF